MASAGFMFVIANGNDVTGGSTVTSQGRENSIEVIELRHDVGLLTTSIESVGASRRHKPIVVLVRVDQALPVMYKAWSNNEVCEVTIKFWQPDPAGTGAEVEFFNITLTNARVDRIELHFPNRIHPDTAALPDQVAYSFVYETIAWEHLDGNVGHQDSWRSDPA